MAARKNSGSSTGYFVTLGISVVLGLVVYILTGNRYLAIGAGFLPFAAVFAFIYWINN